MIIDTERNTYSMRTILQYSAAETEQISIRNERSQQSKRTLRPNLTGPNQSDHSDQK